MKKFILPFLLLMASPVAAEDFLGENEPDKVVEEEKPKSRWEDDKWISLPNERWMVVDYKIWPMCGMIYLSKHEGMYDSGVRDVGFYLRPLKDEMPEINLGNTAYSKLKGKSTIAGSFVFDGGESIKVKFVVDEKDTWQEDTRLIRVNNFNLNILRSMASSETMEINVKGQAPITIPLDEFKEAYEQLAVCFERVKERAPG